jgi:hypothetical protein
MKLFTNEQVIILKHPKHGERILDRRWAINHRAIERGKKVWVVNPLNWSVFPIELREITKTYGFQTESRSRKGPRNYEAMISKLQSAAKQQAHKLHLEKQGINPPSMSTRPHQGVHRETGCWSCRQVLDSDDDMACAVCGWLLCDCGACGCGYGQPS